MAANYDFERQGKAARYLLAIHLRISAWILCTLLVSEQSLCFKVGIFC